MSFFKFLISSKQWSHLLYRCEVIIHMLALALIFYLLAFINSQLSPFNPVQVWIWYLNNKGLNCVGPLIYGVFSIPNAMVPHDLGLVESLDAEKAHVCRADSKLHVNFPLCRALALLMLLWCSRVNCVLKFLSQRISNVVQGLLGIPEILLEGLWC